VGLLLTIVTGWLPFDPIVAIFVALNILWTDMRLIRQSFGGLMDEVDPKFETSLRRILEDRQRNDGIEYHGLRHRNSGNTTWVEFHLLFKGDASIREAHGIATAIETEIENAFPH
jgi:divalent metal cation (Fe/Co/Zn/Cd) transporter